jgi:hypothetical protein
VPDLEAVTVRYEAPATVPGVYTLLHDFDEDGDYIGIVTAGGGDAGRVLTAVFPFSVGGRGFGPWPWIVAALLLLQLNYGFWRRRRGAGTAALLPLLILLPFTGAEALGAETASGDAGRFTVEYAPSLDPLVINRMHHWDLVIRDADGSPVSGAVQRRHQPWGARAEDLPRQVRAGGVRNGVVHVQHVEPLVLGHLDHPRRERERVGLVLEERVFTRLHRVKKDVLGVRVEPRRQILADEVHAVAAPGKFLADFRRDHAAAAEGGIAGDADSQVSLAFHRASSRVSAANGSRFRDSAPSSTERPCCAASDARP